MQFTSANDGVTWSAETVLINTGKDIRDVEVTRLANDDLICTYTERSSGVGADDFTPYIIKSTDDGATWGSPVHVATSFTHATFDGFVTAKVIELANGDLLAALYGLDAGGVDGTNNYCRLSKSTDAGATWADFGTIVAAGTSSRVWQEPVLLLRPNGDIYCTLRSDTEPQGIFLTVSTDDGSSWSAPTRLFDGSGRPTIFEDATGVLWICYRRQQSANGTCAVRSSADDGVTWSKPYDVDGSLFGYGGFVSVPTGLGLLYSRELSAGATADLKFVLLS